MSSWKCKLTQCNYHHLKGWNSRHWHYQMLVTTTLIHDQWLCEMPEALGKTVWWFLTKPSMLLSYSIVITHQNAYPKEKKNSCSHKHLHRDIHNTFIRYCQNREAVMMCIYRWMDKLWYIKTTEYYLALKWSELSSHEKMENLKCALLNERSPSEKVASCMIP